MKNIGHAQRQVSFFTPLYTCIQLSFLLFPTSFSDIVALGIQSVLPSLGQPSIPSPGINTGSNRYNAEATEPLPAPTLDGEPPWPIPDYIKTPSKATPAVLPKKCGCFLGGVRTRKEALNVFQVSPPKSKDKPCSRESWEVRALRNGQPLGWYGVCCLQASKTRQPTRVTL